MAGWPDGIVVGRVSRPRLCRREVGPGFIFNDEPSSQPIVETSPETSAHASAQTHARRVSEHLPLKLALFSLFLSLPPDREHFTDALKM